MKKIICTADWHLRTDVPKCRTETESEWIDFQFSVLKEMFDTKPDYVLIAGDIFHRAKPATKLVNRLLSFFNQYKGVKIFACAGNHDVSYHNIDLLPECAYQTLIESKVFSQSEDVLSVNFNTEPDSDNVLYPIVLHHEYCSIDSPSYIKTITPDGLIKKYSLADLIVCGDNHTGFTKDKVIVPGSITIQNADQINYKPSYYTVKFDEGNSFVDLATIKKHILPTNKEYLSNKHIEESNERNDRITAFVENLKTKGSISLSFQDNLKLASQQASQPIQNIITEIGESI